MLGRNDDGIAMQALKWTQNGHRGNRRPKNNLEKKAGEWNVDSRFLVQIVMGKS